LKNLIKGRQQGRAEVRVPVTGLWVQFEGIDAQFQLLDVSPLGIGVTVPDHFSLTSQKCRFQLKDVYSKAEISLEGEIRFREKNFWGILFQDQAGVKDFLKRVLDPVMVASSIQDVSHSEFPPGVQKVFRGNGFECVFFQEKASLPLIIQICWKGAVVELQTEGVLSFVPFPLVVASGVLGGGSLAVELGEVKISIDQIREELLSLLGVWSDAPDVLKNRLFSGRP
jgi:hypothetical protein